MSEKMKKKKFRASVRRFKEMEDKLYCTFKAGDF